MKKENENISFNFYLQVLVLIKTERQIIYQEYANINNISG